MNGEPHFSLEYAIITISKRQHMKLNNKVKPFSNLSRLVANANGKMLVGINR